MELKEAILGRRSIRGYLQEPVSQETIHGVLELATRAVSALNMQPWELTVVTGAPLDAIRERNIEDLRAGVPFDVPEPEFGGAYRTRRVAIAKQLFKAMDIQRKIKRAAHGGWSAASASLTRRYWSSSWRIRRSTRWCPGWTSGV